MPLFEKGAPVVLRALAALTDSYESEDADLPTLSVATESMVTLQIAYEADNGGEGIEVLPEVQLQGFDDWTPAAPTLVPGTPASGTIASEVVSTSYTVTTDGVRLVNVPVYGASRFRVRVRELGGSIVAAGQGRVVAVASRVGV